MRKNIFLVLIKRSTIFLINLFFKKTEKIEKILSLVNLNITFNNLKDSKTYLTEEDLHKDVFLEFLLICVICTGVLPGFDRGLPGFFINLFNLLCTGKESSIWI